MSPKTEITAEEWVRRLNALGAELDTRCASLHPSAWALDPDIARLKAQYRTLAKQPTED